MDGGARVLLPGSRANLIYFFIPSFFLSTVLTHGLVNRPWRTVDVTEEEMTIFSRVYSFNPSNILSSPDWSREVNVLPCPRILLGAWWSPLSSPPHIAWPPFRWLPGRTDHGGRVRAGDVRHQRWGQLLDWSHRLCWWWLSMIFFLSCCRSNLCWSPAVNVLYFQTVVGSGRRATRRQTSPTGRAASQTTLVVRWLTF